MTVTTGSTSSSPGTGMDAGLTYLIGESIYLRGLEIGDAKWGSAWRFSPFPLAAQSLEERLKKTVPKSSDRRLTTVVACRRNDDRIVGSAHLDDFGNTESVVLLHADPALQNAGAEIQAEMLGLLVPWLIDERHRPLVRVTTDAGMAPVLAAGEGLGMRLSARLRDGSWRNGAFHDRLFLEAFNPRWLDRVGDPGAGIDDEREAPTPVRSPAPRRDSHAALPLPNNAVIGSERLALRPQEVDDAERIARWIRAEPQNSFGHSRFPYSAIMLGDWFGEIGTDDIPENLELGVVLRETGELIGENGLYAIDWMARTAETGSWIYRPEYRNAGYGTEAKHLLLEYAFDRIGLHSVWSWVKTLNPRSQAALRKQGYRDAGRFNWVGFGPDGFESAQMFDLLASEWRAARDRGASPGREG